MQLPRCRGLVVLALLAVGCQRPIPSFSVTQQGGIRPAGIRQVGADSLNRFGTAVASPSGAFQCLVVESPNGPGRGVIAAWPDTIDATVLVNIEVTRRPEAIRYEEVRSPVPFRTISVPTARARLMRQGYRTTSISMDFVTGNSFVQNLGGARPEESIMVTTAQAWANRAAGAPGRRAEQVLAKCLPRTTFPAY